MNAAAAGRGTFIGLPPAGIVLFYILSAASIALFTWGAVRLVRKYRSARGKPRSRPTFQIFVRTTWRTICNITVLRDDRYAGIAHLFVLSGFFVLFIGTLIVLVDRDILRFILPSWTFWSGSFYLYFSAEMDVFGLVLLAGLLMLALRRAIFRLPQLDYTHSFREGASRQFMAAADWVFLGLIFLIVLGGFALEAVRLAAERPEFEVWSPVGWWVSDLLLDAGVNGREAAAVYPVFWWFHVLTSLAFVAYIPWSKAAHILLGYVSLAWRDESLPANLPAAPENEAAGYATAQDMTWLELVSLDACIRCGRCHARCPSAQAGLPLSPRDVVLELQWYADAGTRMLLKKRNGNPSNGNGGSTREASGIGTALRAMPGDVIPKETLWSCTSCSNCGSHCPVGVNHVPMMVQMRRALVSEGAVDEQLQQTLINLQRCGNAMGQSDRLRAKWTKDLPFNIPDARREDVEFLWFVGDNASYDPRVQEYTRTVARLFDAASLDFGILYEAERNAGNDVRRIGEEGLFEMLAEKNIRTLEKCRFRAIVTTDPHSYNTLKNEYPALGASWPVFHYTELLLTLIEAGHLLTVRSSGVRATYQDPCYLARYNGVDHAPRALLQRAGVEIVEMPRHGRDAWCCGAGGGRLWMEDIPARNERPAEQRIREAAALPGVDTIVTACPKDIVMFTDAIKNVGMEGRFFVRDVAHYVWEAIEQPITEHLEKEA